MFLEVEHNGRVRRFQSGTDEIRHLTSYILDALHGDRKVTITRSAPTELEELEMGLVEQLLANGVDNPVGIAKAIAPFILERVKGSVD